MAKKSKTPQEQMQEAVAELVERYNRWQDLYKNGCFDPNYCDGVNLNFVRNHIHFAKRKIEKLVEEHKELSFPEEYEKIEIPQEVSNDYMANPEKIIREAKETLSAMEEDENYKYLLSVKDDLTDKEKEKIYFSTVISYRKWLKDAIERNDLVYMKLYREATRKMKLNSFKECVERVKNCLENRNQSSEPVFIQMSLF
jgi:hypothetical protein